MNRFTMWDTSILWNNLAQCVVTQQLVDIISSGSKATVRLPYCYNFMNQYGANFMLEVKYYELIWLNKDKISWQGNLGD